MEFNKKTLSRIFVVVAGCIVLYWLLHATENVKRVFGAISGVFAPFVTGAAIAFVLNVPMRGIERHLKKITSVPLKRTLSIVLTLLVMLLVLALVFGLLIPQLIRTFDTLVPQVYEFFIRLEADINHLLNENPDLLKWIVENTDLDNLNWSALVEKAISMFGKSLSSIATQAVSAIGSITGMVVNLVISIVFAIYCLFQKETLARQGRKLLYAFLPENSADYIVRVMRLSNSTFSNFLSGQCIEVCILGSMFAVGMAIFRMPYIPLVSVLVAVTAFIPVVGAWVGCILGAFLILVDDAMLAVGFVIMFLVLQQIEGNMIYPKVVGTSIGLPGMWVLLAVAIGGKIMGVAGMFLMIPAASVLYTLIRELTNKKLEKREIEASKLVPQPPELSSHFKQSRKASKEKRELKKFQKKFQKK